jgi:hypothetical protein
MTSIDLPIFSLIHRERSTYGLRHQEYSRYHRHCTSKVAHLRKKLDLVQTVGTKAKKGVYKKKSLEDSDERITNEQ